MEKSSPLYFSVREAHKAARAELFDPLLSGPIGKMAKRDLDARAAVEALFPKSLLANSEVVIADTVSRLSAKNPVAAQQLVRTYVEEAGNTPLARKANGEAQFGGASLAAALVGNPQTEKNLFAALEALPHNQGVADGVKRLMEALRATGERQPIGSKTAFNAQTLEDLKQGHGLKEVALTLNRLERWPRQNSTTKLGEKPLLPCLGSAGTLWGGQPARGRCRAGRSPRTMIGRSAPWAAP